MKRALILFLIIEISTYLIKAFIDFDLFWISGMETWKNYDRLWFLYFMVLIPVLWSWGDYKLRSNRKDK
jgi:hypothetical protein